MVGLRDVAWPDFVILTLGSFLLTGHGQKTGMEAEA
jgi:hypothetical protein